ncbi:hypothetical protein AVEN_1072-1 [Araneus ventricosus]|uniref:HTH psq-type domain-containing protein n=1 Tax=Araneus ventricosus TaxID=182803 RepID=A0A4Y2KAU1_ARAVE|nr:hypothetical protein AVEN_1072-1 [Araneus ventricosus]
MSGLKLKRNVLNDKQKLEILQGLDNGESASTDALNEGNTISHSFALQSVETLLDYMGQKGFDYGDITVVRQICVDIRKEMNKQQKQRGIAVGSSVASERLVSTLNDVVSDERCQLTDQHIAGRVFMSRLDDKYWPMN